MEWLFSVCILLLTVCSGKYWKHIWGQGDTQFQKQLGRRTRETGKKVERRWKDKLAQRRTNMRQAERNE